MPTWLARCLVLAVVAAGVGGAVPASGATQLTRVQVDWSMAEGSGPFSPAVNVYYNGGFRAQCGGAPPGTSGVCEAKDGFHWDQSNFNAGGYARTISLVDEQAEQARRICVEVKHASFRGHYDVAMTITDPDGSTRTTSFGLDTNQVSPMECSPVEVKRPAVNVPPTPDWWLDGRRAVLALGGKCTPTRREIPATDPTSGRQNGTYVESEVNCIKRNRVKHNNSFCNRGTSEGNPRGDGYFFLCYFEIAPGSKRGWRCYRSTERTPGFANASDPHWREKHRNENFQRHAKSLATCLKGRGRK
jgi:hypothetical protein